MSKPIPRRKNYPSSRDTRTASFLSQHWCLITWIFLSLIFAGGFIAGGVWGWAWMQKPTSFPIKQIHIQGQLMHETPHQLQYIVQEHLNGGFFSLNISPIKQAFLDFPWINTVSFRRVWPSALLIRVVEQHAVARFGNTGVLNTQGGVFYPEAKTIPANLPRLDGPIDQSQTLLRFYHTADLLVKLLHLSIIELKLNAVQSWSLMLSNQVKVTLGHDDALARFKRFLKIYPQIQQVSSKPILSVDLRYPNGIAVEYGSSINT